MPHKLGGLNPDGTPINKKFLGKDPEDINIKWSESFIQMFIIQEARRSGYIITGSMEQGLRSKSSGGKAKANGMTAGMPDMLIWLSGNNLKCIELKTKDGKLSPSQKEFHLILRNLGFSVNVIYASCPMDGWKQVKEIINNELDKRFTKEK